MECSNRKPRQVATVPDITHGRLTVRTAEAHPVANGNTDVNVALRSGRTWGLQAAPVTDFFLLDGTFDGTFDGVAQGQHGCLGWGRHCSQMQPCCFGNNKRRGRTNDPGRHTPTPNGNTDVNVVLPSGRTWCLAGLHRLP